MRSNLLPHIHLRLPSRSYRSSGTEIAVNLAVTFCISENVTCAMETEVFQPITFPNHGTDRQPGSRATPRGDHV